ncbi:sulfur carrier protein ThiS [Geodermatophilus sp. DSM 44513]|uniref:sulfur carrier protein ThiS n=1 Tax=Geodermatophilus sp. DSM 44513 TaxID=1528104 RepID=UPI00127065CD|nr:sulfur carrier protein ThiS [Geodermatophilus sp. DSM 44513]WNV75217.1 sulfur carrier protein ThiS [Geodermatophilus sp. DSM 44513]
MQLTVNGTPTELAEGTTVAQLLARHAQQRRVAVAVNRTVVPRSAWAHTVLAAGDDVEILTAVAGG